MNRLVSIVIFHMHNMTILGHCFVVGGSELPCGSVGILY